MAIDKLNTRGTLAQDKKASQAELAMAREQLKQFRHDISILKRKGLLNKELYDARSVKPTKYLNSVIKQFASVLNGTAQVVKIPKGSKTLFKELGYAIKGNRAIVAVQSNEKAIPTKRGIKIKAVGRGGFVEKIPLHFKRDNLLQWANEIRKASINLKKDELLTFQYFGNNINGNFSDPELMVEYLERYTSYEMALGGSAEEQQEVIDNVVVFKIHRDENGRLVKPEQNYMAREKSAERVERDRLREQRRYQRRLNNMSEEQEERYHESKALRERERRQKIRESDPERLLQQREAAKIRAQISRDKKKNGKS